MILGIVGLRYEDFTIPNDTGLKLIWEYIHAPIWNTQKQMFYKTETKNTTVTNIRIYTSQYVLKHLLK